MFVLAPENDECLLSLSEDLKAKLSSLDIKPDELKVDLENSIGRGNFGVIYMGELCRDEQCTTVAVKTLRGNAPTLLKLLKKPEHFHMGPIWKCSGFLSSLSRVGAWVARHHDDLERTPFCAKKYL